MGVAKFTPTKRIAAVCVRNRKPYQLPTLQRQAKAARLLKALQGGRGEGQAGASAGDAGLV
jgi:hypothetical protein